MLAPGNRAPRGSSRLVRHSATTPDALSGAAGRVRRDNDTNFGLAGHRRAASLALAAALDALVHVAHLLAAVSTCLADFCTRFAVVGVVITVSAHEIDAGGAGRCTIEHELDVLLLDVCTALGKAVVGQHIVEGGVAFLAVFQAVLLGDSLASHLIFL